MRIAPTASLTTIALAVFTLASASAQDPRIIHIPSEDAAIYTEAEWDLPLPKADGPMYDRSFIAEGDAAATAPEGASRYSAQEYNFPMGALRVLKWDSGPVIHQITFETQLYVLKGTATVGVAGEIVTINAGDAVFLPSGILRNTDPDGETVVLTYIVSNTSDAPKAKVVRGEGLNVMAIAQWMDGEAPTTATDHDAILKAPDGAAKFTVKRYSGDGNSFRHAVLEAGGRTTPATNGRDILIYINKGRMTRTEDGIEYTVEAGDAIREENAKSGYWEILEDSEFIATDMPFDPSQPRYNLQRSPNAVAGAGYRQE
jgi:quercetin dioxygenase-like cupin family protein